MDLEDRAKQVIAELLDARLTPEDGHSQIDVGRVSDVVRRDPDAVAFAIEKIMGSPHAGVIGWGIWMMVAVAFEAEFDDDSLMVLVESAAAAAGQKLPKIREFRPKEAPAPSDKFVMFQMAEADVAAGDAHRLLMLFRLDTMTRDMRQKLIGKMIITCPAAGDPRPVQHIPRVRAFVADLHRRLPYFPLFLTLDPAHYRQLVYFGCLADVEATKVGPDGGIGLDAYHPSVLEATRTALSAIRDACTPLGIDWSGCAEGLLAPYDEETRQYLLSAQ